jgi:hypothetical protein
MPHPVKPASHQLPIADEKPTSRDLPKHLSDSSCPEWRSPCIIPCMMLRSRMAKMWRLGFDILLGLSLAYGLLLMWVHVRESAIRSRSEALFAQFLRLQPGKTDTTEVEALRKQWAGALVQGADCRGADCEYTLGEVWGYSRWFSLTRFAHDHQPSSQLILKTRGNLLSSASFSVGVVVAKGYGTREERKWLSDPNYVPYSTGEYQLFGRASLVTDLPDTRPLSNADYRIWGPSGCMNCLAIWVSALPRLAPTKRDQIFQIGFDCMTQWSVCTDKDDIMPAAGREKAQESAPVQTSDKY